MCSLSDDYIISNFDDSIVISIDTYATENEDEFEDVYDIESSYHEQTRRIIKFASRLKFIRLAVFPDF